jgi:hypothetical protein
MRRVRSQLCGATPMERRNAREKWLTDKRYLPRRESTPDRSWQRSHASIGLSHMYPDRQKDVVDKQLARLVGMAQRRQHRPPETANRGVVETHGVVAQIANSRRVGVVSDRVERATREVEKQNVVRLVEKSDRIALQVMDTSLASPHVADGHEPPVLPIYAIGVIAEGQSDEKSIFPLEGPAQSWHRVIASRFRDGHVSRAQDPRDDGRRMLDSQPLGKALPVTFTRRHSDLPSRGSSGPDVCPCRFNLPCSAPANNSPTRQISTRSDQIVKRGESGSNRMGTGLEAPVGPFERTDARPRRPSSPLSAHLCPLRPV